MSFYRALKPVEAGIGAFPSNLQRADKIQTNFASSVVVVVSISLATLVSKHDDQSSGSRNAGSTGLELIVALRDLTADRVFATHSRVLLPNGRREFLLFADV